MAWHVGMSGAVFVLWDDGLRSIRFTDEGDSAAAVDAIRAFLGRPSLADLERKRLELEAEVALLRARPPERVSVPVAPVAAVTVKKGSKEKGP